MGWSSGTSSALGDSVETAEIADDAVTYAKLQNVMSSRLLGRATAGSGNAEEIGLGASLAFSTTNLQAGWMANVKDPPYNAVGDGTTDDTAAIQAAIDTGRMVFIPPGTYRVGALTMSTAGQQLIGAGSGQASGDLGGVSVLKAKASFTGHILELDGARGALLMGVGFHGNDTAASGVFYDDGNGTRTAWCKALHAQVGFRIDHGVGKNNNNMTFSHCNAEDNSLWGFAIMPGTASGSAGDNQAIKFDNCVAFQNGTDGTPDTGGGFLIKQAINSMSRCTSEGNFGYGIQLGETIDSNGSSYETMLFYNHFEANGEGGIRLESAIHTVIYSWGNSIEGWSRNTSKSDPPVVIEQGGSNNAGLIIRPQISANDGIQFKGSSGTPTIAAAGPSTNLSLFLQGKGTGGVQVAASGSNVGFYGTTPQAKPSVTGSRRNNAALADLLTDLATVGLLTDSSTAGTEPVTVLRKTADQASTSTSLADVTDLTTSVTSGVTYAFDFSGSWESAATTTGLSLSVNGPTVTNFQAEIAIGKNTGTSPGTGFSGWSGVITALDSKITADAIQATGVRASWRITGVITPSANGTLAVRFATEVGTSSVTIHANSRGVVSA